MVEFHVDRFNYGPIDLGCPAFRLLRILKGQGLIVCCELFQAFLTTTTDGTDAISYEALSYVWGSDKRDRVIEINGKRFMVTRNLHDALQQLQLPNRDRIVWADAVYINHSNKDERGHQVRHMSQIYKRASRVIYWLGPPTLETDHCLRALRSLETNSRSIAHKN
ncbi:heterokaryon incompatibility protein-domain-containing protein [Lasiosphaeria ovina]|uniref:Heterokaryon incompatibility protein-domain-containing protein n=1 Tax=Lasiosphaeria ovina TaxID=92902 RepID=A0AAE0JUW7_9PEZI|nr:heterokaryon incompatibility protein-domain-containing protein [Lasiosphaeria ovina]